MLPSFSNYHILAPIVYAQLIHTYKTTVSGLTGFPLTNLYWVVCLDIVQSMKKPKLFWVSAGAPLVSVILSTLIVFAFKANSHGISVVIKFILGPHTVTYTITCGWFWFYFVWQIGELPKGLNPPSWNMLQFKGTHLVLAIKTGITTGVIALTVSSPFHFDQLYQVSS